MSNGYQVTGNVAGADFTLKIHRGDGMCLLAMDWRNGTPPDDFVGFAIEYTEPGQTRVLHVNNRLDFDVHALPPPGTKPPIYPTRQAPIQKFRWVHFPFNADLPGDFTYTVTPMFMDAANALTAGTAQTANIALARETYPGVLNVAFTRGFVSSQAFTDNYLPDGPLNTLLPADAKKGLTFTPTHRDAVSAYAWMGFEARRDILDLLDAAVADATAEVRVVAYDLNLPEIVDRLATLGSRARVIIDDSAGHSGSGAAEDSAATELVNAGAQVKRQHLGKLQHNKTIVVGGTVQKVICGSTNMSWRGLFVQSNNALTISGATAVDLFAAAFDSYWQTPDDNLAVFSGTASATWQDLGLPQIDAKVAFSPHNKANAALQGIADDLPTATSSIFYSLAFLSTTPGAIRTGLKNQADRPDLFVAGISDKRTGLEVTANSSNLPPTFVTALDADAPNPFRAESKAGSGTRMHHKFIVLDFDKAAARVYLGSYNMSTAADQSNGENLVLVRDRRVATSYMIEALEMIDHYQFRVYEANAATTGKPLTLKRPPRAAGDVTWWAEDYADAHKIKDRELFA